MSDYSRNTGSSSSGGRGRGGSGGRGGFGGGGRGGGGRGGGGGGGRPQKPVIVFNQNVHPTPVADPQVTKIGDAYVSKNKSLASTMAKASLSQHYPTRPGFGKLGAQISVYANYFKVLVPKELSLTRYNVEITPAAQGKKLSRVFQLLLGLPEFAGVATEWKSMIVTRQPLGIPNDYTCEVPYMAEGEEEPREGATVYNVRVVTPLTFSVTNFTNFLTSENPAASFDQRLEVVQVLNAVFGHHPQSDSLVATVGGNKHFALDRSPNNFTRLGGGLEALRGYFRSIRPSTGGILLNVNVTHMVFLEPDSLASLYPRLGTGDKTTLNTKLNRKRVRVTHIPPKRNRTSGQDIPRVKTILGLAKPRDGHSEDHPPIIGSYGAGPQEVEFWLSDSLPGDANAKPAAKSGKPKPTKPPGGSIPSNTYISVFKYFKIKYPQITLNPNLPVVNVGSSEHPMYLPAEVCVVLAGQPIKRRLSPTETQAMIKFACRAPYENANSIVGDGRAVLGLNQAANAMPAQFGMSVGASLITVAARVLPAPMITYKTPSGSDKLVSPRFGSWNMEGSRFHTPGNVKDWTCITFNSNRRGHQNIDSRVIKGSVGSFADYLTQAGIRGTYREWNPSSRDLLDGDETGNDAKIGKVFEILFKSPKRPFLVLCILPYQDVAIYNKIKTVADTRAGIHTVCCIGQKFTKPVQQLQYFGNISLKYNLKGGGVNHVLDPAKLGVISEGKTMVVGIDVTHPSPGSKEGAPSVAAVVASSDRHLAQWPSTFNVQESRREMVSALESMIMSRLAIWVNRNKNLPDNLLIYRDGVSEGQYQTVLDSELPLIRNACRQKYPATATKQGFPHISFIICGKRHHTRFYPTTTQTADRSSNCQPGTVVDRGVTETGNWDFFLQSHACLQGTARPCHYFVLLDEIFRARNLKPPHQSAADALEELTHNMCHVFPRATKAVSLCPAAYYADLVCTRARCYKSDQFDPRNPNPPSETGSITSGAPSQVSQSALSQIDLPVGYRDSMFYI